MIIDVLTLFPAMFSGPFGQSIVKRATLKGKVTINLINIRDFGLGRHRTVDDKPYGGGVGMVMRVDVLVRAIESLKSKIPKNKKGKTVLLDPKGKTYNQEMARSFANLDQLILICGHYEGIDERIKKYVDMSVSIGDYILTGGEIPAMAIVDSVVRLLPGVLEKPQATKLESFSKDKNMVFEHPQYTRPEIFDGQKVPAVLLSGDHQKIKVWQEKNSIIKK